VPIGIHAPHKPRFSVNHRNWKTEMARGPDNSSRIERLQRALERAKTFAKDEVLESGPMCDLLGFSWPTVRGWCDAFPDIEGEGRFTRGGNGIKWRFHPEGFTSAVLAHFANQAEKQGAKNRDLQRRVGVTLPDSEASADLDETRKLVGLTLDINATKVKQGLYVPADQVIEFLDGYNRAVVDGIMGVQTQIDPTGQLPPELRAKNNEALVGVANQVHGKAAIFIEEQRARLQQTGVDPRS
jgi:hypothetical protein